MASEYSSEIAEVQGVSPIWLRDVYGYLKLPYIVMKKSGGAVRTFATIDDLTSRKNPETFHSVGKLAEYTNLPESTIRDHLKRLDHDGWIMNKGRQKRRTPTWRLLAKGLTGDYATLPKWFNISTSAVALLYATVLARHCQREQCLSEEEYRSGDVCQYDGYAPNLERFGRKRLMELTGLSRPAVVRARQHLEAMELTLEFQDYKQDEITILLKQPKGLGREY